MDFINEYTPSDQTRTELAGIKPLFLVGPTGSGKDTIQRELIKSGKFYKIVTYTSRQPRINDGIKESDGEDYHFISVATAKDMAREHKFIEVTINHDNIYGTSIKEFLEAKSQNKTPILDIDVKGVEAFNNISSNFTAVFLLPTSFDITLERLKKRYGNSAYTEEINTRLKTALTELRVLLNENYYYAVINNLIDSSVKNILDICSGLYSGDKISSEARNLANQLISDISAYLSLQK